MSPPPVSISCTVVVMPSPSGNLKSRIYLNLVASSALLSNRCGINSMLIGSLLTLLRQKILAEGGASDYISQVIVETSSRFGDVEVATTRVPEFGSKLETPVFAYRSLGLLSSLDLRMGPPPAPPAVIIHNQELLALLADNSSLQAFLRSWSMMGVRPDTHFIIIFYRPEIPNTSHRRSYISLDSHPSKASSPSPLSRESSQHFDADVQAWSAMVHQGATSSQPQSIISREVSPASGMEANVFSAHYQPTAGPPSHLSFPPELEHETNIVPASYQPHTEPLTPLSHSELGPSSQQFQFINSRAASPVSGMRTDITSSLHQLNNEPRSEESSSPTASDFISNTFGITGDEMKSARYNPGEKKLLGMVVNHRSMIRVLERLGLAEKNKFMDTKTLTLSNGQVLTAVEIVKEFAWSPDSFRHKCSWYGWAEEVATSFRWNDPIPG